MLFTARKHTDRLLDRKKNIYCLLGDCVTPLQNFTIYSILKSLARNHFNGLSNKIKKSFLTRLCVDLYLDLSGAVSVIVRVIFSVDLFVS